MALFGMKVRPLRDGRFRIDLDADERALLRSLPAQLRDLLATDDPALERLYPPAYLSDDERNEEYRRLMRGDLTATKLSSLDVLEATADETVLDEEQLVAWMGALNDLRLVLGTRLDVSEDMDDESFDEDDPRATAYAIYWHLGYLQEWVIQALSTTL